MNISNPRRVSFLRASTYQTPCTPRRPPTFHRSDFNPVDFLAFKAACDAERAAKPDYLDVDLFAQPIHHPTAREKIHSMLTVYPCRDMGWLVSVVFMLGSTAFASNAVFGLLPPNAIFDGIATASLVSSSMGSFLFLLAGFMNLLTAFNVDRGIINPKVDGEVVYKPALIGSEQWVWLPTSLELRTVFFPSLAFRAGLVQLAGGFAFAVPAIAGLPGVVHLTDPSKILIFISAPQIIGGSLFLCAGLVVLALSQDKWYRPNPFDASWQNALWNTMGGASFFSVGIIAVMASEQVVASSSLFLLGSGSYLIGSLIQWYIIMENYPS